MGPYKFRLDNCWGTLDDQSPVPCWEVVSRNNVAWNNKATWGAVKSLDLMIEKFCCFMLPKYASLKLSLPKFYNPFYVLRYSPHDDYQEKCWKEENLWLKIHIISRRQYN